MTEQLIRIGVYDVFCLCNCNRRKAYQVSDVSYQVEPVWASTPVLVSTKSVVTPVTPSQNVCDLDLCVSYPPHVGCWILTMNDTAGMRLSTGCKIIVWPVR